MREVRFGLVGCGAWGSHHARAIRDCPRARLIAVADSHDEARSQIRASYPDAVVLADYRELLAMPEVDVVDVVLPNDLHHEAGCAVLDAGKHLLMEKPMALTLPECDDLIERARAGRLVLSVAHQFRFSSLWGRIREFLDAGVIGAPGYVNIDLWRNAYRQGRDGWRYDPRRVGNWILEEPIHFFDLARWYLSGRGDPVSIYSRGHARRAEFPNLHDDCSAILGFPGGAFAVVSQTLSACEHHLAVRITGEGGALWAEWGGVMDRTWNPTYSLRHFDGRTFREVPIDRPTGEVYELADLIADMAGAVGDGRPPRITGEDGRWAVSMCLKAQESVESGAVVSF
ncbi:MAG TPA: Gfo/Idh/MocA family oxidoreductase [Phycisphaerae bacterium]|nr:Gfo/Idh/MocA family oxidoreductase [Phycisphaerae bacterium]